LEEYDPMNQYDYLFPFGHGLSYTSFTYSELSVNSSVLSPPSDKSVQVSVKVKNTGKEVVMLYINQDYASVPRPVRQLKKFDKIELKVGESKTLTFTLDLRDLSFINLKSKRVYEAGNITVYVDNLQSSFILQGSGSL
jgi:beta-glucosidase